MFGSRQGLKRENSSEPFGGNGKDSIADLAIGLEIARTGNP
jgi:hypothetical protein